jgi:hydroxymethylpyrimidine pyrophosphatase-like HAD family hydrolase
MHFSKSKIEKLYRCLTKKYKHQLEVSYTHPLLLEITAKNVNKGNALLSVANILNIKSKNIAMIGDSGNDLSMAKVSQLSIGLKTKSRAFKNYVDVYYDFKKNGVAKAINEHLIGKDIRLIISDADGTLLNNQRKAVNEDTRKVVYEAFHKHHCKLSICSGRGIDDCSLILKNLKLNTTKGTYIIGTNGGFIYDCENNKNIYQKFMNRKYAKQLVECFMKV